MHPAIPSPRGFRRVPVPILIGALAAALATRPALAQPAIEWVTPVAPVGGGTVIVLLKNGQQPVQNVALSWMTREGAVLPFGADPVAALPAGDEQPVTGSVPAELAFAPGDTVLLRVDFAAGAVRQSRFARLPVGRRHGPPPLQVTVLSGAQSLVDYETRRILLQLTDTGAVPLRVDSIRTRWPPYITLDTVMHLGEADGWPLQIAPGQTRVLAYDVRLSDARPPGQQTLVFDVPVAWRIAGDSAAGNVLTSTTLTLGVLGESELLKVLTLPSLLFVPGFLILVMLGLLWRVEAFAHSRPRLTLPSKYTEPEFWVFSITASIAVWLVVSLVWRRNVLAAYDARDVAGIWIGSLFAGAVLFALIALVYRTWVRSHRSPMRVLHTLARAGRPLVLPRVRFTVGDREGTGFLLDEDDPAAPAVLVAPPIRVRWGNADETVRSEYESRLASRVLTANDAEEVLKEAQRESGAQVFWRQSREIAWPVMIPRADVRLNGRDLLLQVELQDARPAPADRPAVQPAGAPPVPAADGPSEPAEGPPAEPAVPVSAAPAAAAGNGTGPHESAKNE